MATQAEQRHAAMEDKEVTATNQSGGGSNGGVSCATANPTMQEMMMMMKVLRGFRGPSGQCPRGNGQGPG